MDSLDGTSFDSGSSAAALGSGPGSSSDATSPHVQASWGQAMADAGADRGSSADDTGWDNTGSPWDTGATAAASVPSEGTASSQAAEPSAQDGASDAQATAAGDDARAAQASQDAQAILRGMDDRQAAGPSSMGTQLACLEDACIVEGGAALALRYGVPLIAGAIMAPRSPSQPNMAAPAPDGDTAPRPGGNIVESNPGNGVTTPPSGSAESLGQTGSAATDGSPPAGDTQGIDPAPKSTGDTQVMPALPANPDDLLAQGWNETSHPKAAATGRRTFVNPETGQSVEFDKGRPGGAGWRGQDHYHVLNPNSTGRRDVYLDKAGHPVPDGSKPSHIPPGK